MRSKSSAEGGAAPPETKVPAAWTVPLITAAILAAAFLAYYFVYVGARREYLANRNFRALALLGEQIQQSVSIHGNILDFCAELFLQQREETHVKKLGPESFLILHPEDKVLQDPQERQRAALGDYLRFLAPGMELNIVQNGSAVGLHMERRGETWELVLGTFRDSKHGVKYEGSLKVDNIMRPLVASLPFDDVLLVSQEGFIVYHSKQTGPQFTTLTALLQAQVSGTNTQADAKSGGESKKTEASKGAGEATIRQNSDPTWRSRSMHFTDLLLAGTRYKLFLQPLLISPFKGGEKGAEPASELVLCGLRSASELDWEALSLSYTFFIWLTVGFFIVWSSYKALKILLMNHRERLRLRELGTLALSLVLLTSVFTLSWLQADFHANDDTDARLVHLSGNILRNIDGEMRDMMKQLRRWCRSDDITKELGQLGNHPINNPIMETIRNREAKGDPMGGKLLQTSLPYAYPFAANIFWTDDDGHQIVKWSTTQYVTPMIDISELPTFARPTMWMEKGPLFQFVSILPPNKLEYLATLGIRTRDCANIDLESDIANGMTVLTAQPLTLIDPILPDGYGFAIVDRGGAVHFHSDKNRNGRENFLVESDGSRELYAAIFGHASPRPIAIKYLGRDYRALVSPVSSIAQAPWSLVVFRDLTAKRTLNLQAMTLTSTLLFAAFVAPVLLVWGGWLTLRPGFAPEWLWPNPHRSNTYLHQIWLYLAPIAVFPLVVWLAPTEGIVAAAFVFPIAALAATWWCYRTYGLAAGKKSWQPAGAAAERESGMVRASHSYRNRYLAAALLLLVLLGVLTPMALFRASLAVERRLAIKEAQVQLGTAIAGRWLAMVERKENSEISDVAWSEIRESQKAWQRIVPDNLTAATELKTDKHADFRGERYQGWLRHLLYLLHHDYNVSSAEMLGVINDRGNPTTWSWEGDDSKVTMRWHGPHPPLRPLPPEVARKGPTMQGDPVNTHDDLVIASAIPGFSLRDFRAYSLIALAAMLGIGALLWALMRRLFLLHMAPLRITGTREVAQAIREGRNVLVLVPPASDWQIEEREKTVDVSALRTMQAWNDAAADLFSTPPNMLIELRHFEFHAEDPEVDRRKVVVLERLLKREGTQVAVIMTVPPSAADYRPKFPALETIDLRDEPFMWLRQYAGPAKELIARECSPLPALWPLGAQLAKDLSPDVVQTEDTVASEILERPMRTTG